MSPLTVVFWDVQHGNTTYIKTPLDKHIVLDLGTGSYGNNIEFSPLLYLKNRCNVHTLDEVIITHPHSDHISDILNFDYLNPVSLKRPVHLTEKEIRDANRIMDKAMIDKYMEINNKYSYPLQPENNPENPQSNGGVNFQVFFDESNSKSNINNHGLVVIVEYLGCKILFPGDVESPTWNALLQRRDFISAITGVDILVASHHGRDAGFCNDIFNFFTPKLTIISDGRFCDTSATSRYSNKTSGWTVYHRNNSNSSDQRKCVTTRNDGVIVIEIGRNDNGRSYIQATVD